MSALLPLLLAIALLATPAAAQSPVCGYTIQTASHLAPPGASPTFWTSFDEPVFVRLFTTERYLSWTVTRVSDRDLPTSTAAENTPYTQSTRLGATLPADPALLAHLSGIRDRCSGNVQYLDVVIDDTDADRSRVYRLDVALAPTAAALRLGSSAAVDSASYSFNVRRYRPVYVEPVTGPVASQARTVVYDVVRETDGEAPTTRLTEAVTDGQVALTLGAVLRPWGYNPHRVQGLWRDRTWWRNVGLLVATPVSGDFLDAFYLGGAFGAHGISAVVGAHFYPRAQPVAGVEVGAALPADGARDDLDELTTQRLRVAPFAGIQLDPKLFVEFFSGAGRTDASP